MTTNGTGQSTCDLCPAGTHQPGDLGECQPCPRGFFSSAPEQATCQPCPPGSFAPDTSSTQCILCPEGFVQETPGQSVCDRCPTDKSFTEEQGASSVSACVSPPVAPKPDPEIDFGNPNCSKLFAIFVPGVDPNTLIGNGFCNGYPANSEVHKLDVDHGFYSRPWIRNVAGMAVTAAHQHAYRSQLHKCQTSLMRTWTKSTTTWFQARLMASMRLCLQVAITTPLSAWIPMR